jgi:S1 RNA binding domain protein
MIGNIVEGEITNITSFGAFIRISEVNEEGLIHISEIADEYVKDINAFCKVGEKVKVKVLSRNKKNNKLELSLKQATEDYKPVEKPEIKPKKPIKITRNPNFEDKLTNFLKKSEEKQIDIRRNIKHKQGIVKRRK